MDNSLVVKLNQAAIDGIRGVGATSQYIFVEGNSYTGAWTWVCSPALLSLARLFCYSMRVTLHRFQDEED